MSIEVQIQQAQSLEAGGDLEAAVQLLLSLNFESAQRSYPDTLKMETYLKAADLCIRLNKIDEAEVQVNRASMLQNAVNDEELLTRYKSLYAIVLDRNLRFAEAATRYYELSLKSQLNADEKANALQQAIICTVLAGRGQQKHRLLMNLFKDDRCQALTGAQIIKEMYLERVINASQLTEFQAILKPHQLRSDSADMTVLKQATTEHNILSLARIYKSISFDSLEQLLQIPVDKIETTVTRMISANLFKGSIDQIDRVITFEGDDMDWDSYIVSVCDQVTKINDLIATKNPDWHKEHTQTAAATTNAQ